MKKLILAALFTAVAAAPALAAGESYYVFKDVVGNCSVAVSSGQDVSGMKVISKSYSSQAAARQAVGSMDECKDSAKPY